MKLLLLLCYFAWRATLKSISFVNFVHHVPMGRHINVRHHHCLISSLSMSKLVIDKKIKKVRSPLEKHAFRNCNTFHKGNHIQGRDLVDSKNSLLSCLNLVAHSN